MFSIILKTRKKSVPSNVFLCVEVCIFWNCIQYTIHWDKTQMLKKAAPHKINGLKTALLFLSRVPTLDLQFLYELKQKVCLCVGFCIFNVILFFLKFIFLFNKRHRLFDLKRHNSFKNKPRTVSLKTSDF